MAGPTELYVSVIFCKVNSQFHLDGKLNYPWTYDYPLTNLILSYEASTNQKASCFLRLSLLSISSEHFPAKEFKVLPTV